ncbi:MAG: T9SS type A sorting domain-containing protein [Fibrobacter sp.]|uniref:T9SS type A sorting domain-containing protein n=1 Tax=Fibrobacter sp. TaxID=35828 RepID=UPI0025BEEBB9|nr:T9SS type A sorting domain-containing protein [Fibrobacter sp.]MBR4784867.1 T9SS type A sorting domain-containing protein [Fibrobacter sp.]
MKKEFAAVALACAASAAFAANTVNPAFLWDATSDDGCDGRVETGSTKTGGYWYEYNDSKDGGTSKLDEPDDFVYKGQSFYCPAYDLLAEQYRGYKMTVKLGEGYEKPYAGFAFNIWDEEQQGADITAWGGLCLEYSSDLDFSIVIEAENEGTVTALADFSKVVSKTDSVKVVDFEWKDFQGAMLDSATKAAVLSDAATVKLHFSGEAGTKGDFFLKKVGSLGQCSGGTDAIKPVMDSRVNVSLSGRMVNFEGVMPSAEVTVSNLRGQVVVNSTAASAMNLYALPAGTYTLRVQGPNVHYSKQITLR